MDPEMDLEIFTRNSLYSGVLRRNYH